MANRGYFPNDYFSRDYFPDDYFARPLGTTGGLTSPGGSYSAFGMGCSCNCIMPCVLGSTCCLASPPAQLDLTIPAGTFSSGFNGSCGSGCLALNNTTFTLAQSFTPLTYTDSWNGQPYQCFLPYNSTPGTPWWGYVHKLFCTHTDLSITAQLTCGTLPNTCAWFIQIWLGTSDVSGNTCCFGAIYVPSPRQFATPVDCDTTVWTIPYDGQQYPAGTCCNTDATKSITLQKH